MSAVLAISKLVVKEIFRKKDFYVALVLIGVILFYASQLKFYNVENIVRYLLEIGLMLVFFFSAILTVALAARQHLSETQNRTLAVLMAKPLTRWQYVFGKFLGSFAAGMVTFIIFYGLFIAIAASRSGEIFGVLAWQSAFLFVLNLLILSAMASGLSYYLTLSANVTITLISYLLINTYGAGLKTASEGLFWLSAILAKAFYYTLPHFEFFDMRQRFVHHWDPLSGGLLGFLTVYAILYAAIFLFIGWLKFRKEPIG